MKPKSILILAFTTAFLCGCGSNMESLPEKDDKIAFSINVPNKARFEFFQSSKISFNSAGLYKTQLLIKELNENQVTTLAFDLLAFKEPDPTYGNLDYRFIRTSQAVPSDTLEITESANTLLSEDKLVLGILSNDSSSLSISGSYDGEAKVYNSTGEVIEGNPIDIIALTGFIDYNNEVFLLAKNPNTSLNLLKGIYSKEGEFIGQLILDSSLTSNLNSLTEIQFSVNEDYTALSDSYILLGKNKIMTIELFKNN